MRWLIFVGKIDFLLGRPAVTRLSCLLENNRHDSVPGDHGDYKMCDPYWIRTSDLFPVKEAL